MRPQNITFFELIRSKARGKSGPLFHFDARDDVRVFNDVRTEKEDSHAGKIVDKKWFERNKHIFPASRWEVVSLCLGRLPLILRVIESRHMHTETTLAYGRFGL